MKRFAFGAAAAGGAAFALHRLAPRVRAMHAHCRAMMRTHCGGASAAVSRNNGTVRASEGPCEAVVRRAY